MMDHFDRFDLAGASVTVVKDGELFVSKGYGHSDIGADAPVEADATLFPTASVSKLFTATAIMQLVEQGKIDLDADVNNYLSSFQIPDTFPEPVRVWHLLSHTAGFEDRPVGLLLRSSDNLLDLETALVRGMPARAWEPGKLTAYSNYGPALAAHLVAEVSGMSWEDYLESHIFQPLGLTHTSGRQPIPEALAPGVTKVYASSDGELVESFFEFSMFAPAGGMVATSQDMGRFMLAHLQQGGLGDERILQEATARQMHGQLFTHDARLPGNAHGFWESDEHGQRTLSHGGDLNTAHTLLALAPEHDLGVYVAYNSVGGPEARAEFATAFWDYVFAADAPAVADQAAGSYAPIEHLAGNYDTNRISTTSLAKVLKLFGYLTVSVEDGVLITDLPGAEGQRWDQLGENEFAQVDGPARMVFGVDDAGRASHIAFGGSVTYSPLNAFLPVPWYDNPALHAGLLTISVLVLVSALVLWPILAIARRRSAAISNGARVARWWAAATGGLVLLFIAMFVLILGDSSVVEYELPALLVVTLSIGVAVAVMTLGVVVHAILAWRNNYWHVAGRLHYTLVAVALVALVWQLNHWNLLGFQV